MRTRLLALLAAFAAIAALLAVAPATAGAVTGPTPVFINEIHYDNTSTDEGEFVEVAGPAGTDLTGWTIELYNGSNGTTYGTMALSGVLADAGQGFGFQVASGPSIQNGAPDGLALIDASGAVIQFLSYEGEITATNGAASGLTSTDIGVSEPSSTPVGHSLQLTGTGSVATDFSWVAPAPNTSGAANIDQTFVTGSVDVQLNEFSVNTTGDDVEYFEIAGSPATDYSAYTILEIQGIPEGSDTPGQVVDAFAMGTTDGSGLFVTNLAVNTIENDPISLLLVKDFTGAVGDDLDTDDDGTFETMPWSEIADSVSIAYNSSINYSPTVLDEAFDDAVYDSTFAPGGASRVPDRTGDWVRNDFDLNPIQPGSPEDGEAENTPGTSNALVTVPPQTAVVLINEVQGPGATSPLVGLLVEVEAIVTALVENDDLLSGFYIQEEDIHVDGDAGTSEGVFVFCGGSCPEGLAVGDLVTVTGEVEEFFGATQIDTGAGGSIAIESSDNDLPTPASLSLPAPTGTDQEATFESTEGMTVSFTSELTVTEYFQLARFGEVVLTSGGRPAQFTDENVPTEAGFTAYQAELAKRRIILDDNTTSQNDPTSDLLDNEPYAYPTPGLSTTNRFRGGDTVTGLTGALEWAFGQWRLRPIDGVDYTFTPANPRPASPEPVGGSMTVASFNVLNYFATVDDGSNNCAPAADQECRGADSEAELVRQRDKIVSAMAAIDADVVGLIEVQNDAGASVDELVDGLNAAAGSPTYAALDTGTIGSDAIKVAFIYKPATVEPTGDFAILDSSVDPNFIDTKNRPVLIQTFTELATDEAVTIAVNHLKSKGSSCADVGDPDGVAGEGNCNGTRTAAAQALADYLATDPTGSGDPDYLIIGDLNAYAMETPITALTDAGYTDLLDSFLTDPYSFVFDGQTGYLDHALANTDLTPQVTGATIWHINADEPSLLDYNDTIQDASEASFERKSTALNLYAPDSYRSSDHDPVIIGLNLDDGVEPGPMCNGLPATIIGTEGNDTLIGTSGPDVIVGLGGRDLIRGLNGDDVICGGDGLDRIFGGNGLDMLFGEEGNDRIYGEGGPDMAYGGDGRDILVGGTDDDMLFGEGDNDRIYGSAGNDMAEGGPGRDTLVGSAGNDTMSGGADADLLNGGAGIDNLSGDDGDDRVIGGAGDDNLDGGPDRDRLIGSSGFDTCLNGELVATCEA